MKAKAGKRNGKKLLNRNHLIDIHIDKKLEKAFVKQIENGAIEGVKYGYTTKSQKDKNLAVVYIETLSKVNVNDMRLGVSIAKLKDALTRRFDDAQKAKVLEELDLEIKMTVPNEALKRLKRMKDELRITRFGAKTTGRYTDVYFKNLTENDDQYLNRLLEIMDAINSAVNNYNNMVDIDYMNRCIAELNKKVKEMKRKRISLVRMSGKELIEKGYAHTYRVFKSSFFLLRALEALFGKRMVEHYYFERLVYPDQEYVVQLRNPIILSKEELVDHAEEISLHYDYGQQVYEGYGMKMVDQYMKTIANMHNAQVDKIDAGVRGSNLKIEK